MSKKTYCVAVVGATGAVGNEFLRCLEQRRFPLSELRLLASARSLGKTLTLGTELFYHGAEGEATPQTKSATLLDFGGYYKFRDPGFQLLFCYGHTVNGQRENYGYLGLYWTWANKSSGTETAMANLGPPTGLGRF